MIITSCYKCTKRTIGCHATCEAYLADRKAYNEQKSKVDANKSKQHQLDDTKLRGIRRMKTMKKSNKGRYQ